MKKIFSHDESIYDEKITSSEEITRIIGVNLKRVRLERGFSLDEVSARSTVSKSMLSDIERGRKCPTVAVLYKICEGLNVSLPSLLKAPDKIVEVSKSQELVHKANFDVQQLFGYDIQTSMEIGKYRIEPGREIASDSKGPNVWKYIMIIDGVFTLVLDGEKYELCNGDAVRFLANRKHTYANRTDKDVWVYAINYYGG